MAVEDLKGSLVMTNVDATPATNVDVSLRGGRTRYLVDTVEMTAAASATSTYLMARLPTNAVIHLNSKLHFDDLASTGSPTIDIGIFGYGNNTADITDDDDALNDGIDVATAAGSSAVIKDIANAGKTLWEHLGLTEDPGGVVDIKLTLKDAACNTGGTLTSEIYYSVD